MRKPVQRFNDGRERRCKTLVPLDDAKRQAPTVLGKDQTQIARRLIERLPRFR